PWITIAVEVPSAFASGTYYELSGDAAPSVVDRMSRRDRRVGYLGEWHSHPADAGPSELDARSVRGIAADRAAECSRPVLIIARRRGGTYQLDARQLHGGRLRPLRLIDAGPLPNPPTPIRSPRRPAKLASERR